MSAGEGLEGSGGTWNVVGKSARPEYEESGSTGSELRGSATIVVVRVWGVEPDEPERG
jgi:hypothetical protein